MVGNKFPKVGKVVEIDPLVRDFENQYFTTRTAQWHDTKNGFLLQVPEETTDNIKRGNHIPEILDSIFELLKWILYRHNEVTVLRYDIYPADTDLDISIFHNNLLRKLKKLRRDKNKTISTLTNKGSAIFKDIQYLWVREKGKHEAGKGIHYHCFVAFRTPDRMTQKQVNEEFRTRATASLLDFIRSKLKSHDTRAQKRLLESYLEEVTSFKVDGSQGKSPIPYITIPGFFWLKRDMLPVCKVPEQYKKMKAIIEASTSNETDTVKEGYKYLNIKTILDRKKHKAEPVGGVLSECIYALSYLSKVITKHELPKHKKFYGKSSMKDSPCLNTNRKNTIQIGKTKIDEIFELYTKRI